MDVLQNTFYSLGDLCTFPGNSHSHLLLTFATLANKRNQSAVVDSGGTNEG